MSRIRISNQGSFVMVGDTNYIAKSHIVRVEILKTATGGKPGEYPAGYVYDVVVHLTNENVNITKRLPVSEKTEDTAKEIANTFIANAAR